MLLKIKSNIQWVSIKIWLLFQLKWPVRNWLICEFPLENVLWVYATGRQNACVWRTWQGYYLLVLSWSSLTSMFSGLLQCSFAKSCFKQNYCHACHARFDVFFPVPSCCVSSVMTLMSETAAYVIMFVLVFKNKHLLCSFNLLIEVKQQGEYEDRKLK